MCLHDLVAGGSADQRNYGKPQCSPYQRCRKPEDGSLGLEMFEELVDLGALRGSKVVVLRRHGPVSGTDSLKLDGIKHAVIWQGVKRNGC